MKNVLICFLTTKPASDVQEMVEIYFNGFRVHSIQEIPPLISNGSATEMQKLFVPAKEISDQFLDIINSNRDQILTLLLPDQGIVHKLPADHTFDMVLSTSDGFDKPAEIVARVAGTARIEAKLDEAKNRYKTLVNNLPGVTYRCRNDSDWTMLYLNRAVEKLTGYPAKAFINNKEHTYSDIIIPQDREYVWLSIQKALKKQVPFRLEYRIKTASGRVKWVWEQGRGIVANGGQEFLEGVILDIDKQKNLEQRIELMREMVMALNASSDLTDLIEIIKKELAKLTVASNFTLSLFDWEKREFLFPFVDEGREFYKRKPMWKNLDALVIKRNRPIFLKRNEIMKLQRQGKINPEVKVPEVWLGVPLQFNGKAAGLIVLQDFENEFAINETDTELLEFVSVQLVVSILKKQAEDESRKLLKALEQSPIAVMITDLEGHIVYANNKASEITGYSIREMTGRIPHIIEPYESDADHYQTIWKSLREKGSWQGEFENKNKSGEKYWEYARLSSIKNARGKTTHYVYVKENITVRKQIEDELRKAKTRAEESDMLKTAFLANMSHEIRTPMNAIIGFTEMLRSDDFSEQEHGEFMDLITENSRKLLSTLDNIIDIAKIEAGQMSISSSMCSANKILYDNFYAFEKKKHKLDRLHIAFSAHQYKENENILFMSDPLRINQVLSNMLENAFKYTTQGTVELGYTLTTEDNTEYIDFYVRDSGEGISPEKMQSIFNRFTQASDNYMNTSGGTGLGLAISRNIARLMNGDIRLESELGKGSAFHFLIPFIPAKEEEQTFEPKKKKKKPKSEWPDKTILIAEDEDSNFTLLEVMLQKSKVKLERAYNGKQAVDYVIGGYDVDLVLMDVRMPVMNGYEAMEHIKKFNPELPVVIQTAFAMASDRESSFEAGCDEYLSKPIKATELYQVLEKFLGN